MSREIKIGLMVLGALAVLYLAAAWAKGGLHRGNRKKYIIEFANVNGLKTSDPVTVRGLEVGQVKEIVPEKDFVQVTIEIAEETDIRKDAQAEILVKEILGGKQIELTLGSATQKLSEETHIPGKPTFDMTMALAGAGKVMQQIDFGTLQSTLKSIDALVYDLKQITHSIDPNHVKNIIAQAESAISEINRLSIELNQRKILEKTDVAITTFDGVGKDARVTLSKANAFADNTDSILKVTGADARILLQKLSKTIDDLKLQQSLAGKLLYDTTLTKRLDVTLNNLNQTLEIIKADRLKVSIGFGRPKAEKK